MPTKYATAQELDRQKDIVAYAENVEKNPALISKIDDRSEFDKRKKQAQAIIDSKTAPAPKDDSERRVLRERQELLEAFITKETPEIGKPDMPSRQEMWETPAGAVGKHLKWENSIKNYTLDGSGNVVKAKAGYGAAFEWKDNQRKLRGDDEAFDPDIANLEKLRSEKRDKSSFADYKSIMTAGSPKFKANYDEVFPDHVPTPVEAKMSEKAESKFKNTGYVPSTRPICGRIKKNGEKCNNRVLEGLDYCRHHRPEPTGIPEEV
jgi:hypothetical protein